MSTAVALKALKGLASTGLTLSTIAAQVAETLRVKEAQALKEDLHAFVQRFWHCVEPDKAFEDNWHIRVICQHLEALERGEFRNLIINVPPGTSKSTLVSVMFPAWVWARSASKRIFGASYSEPLSLRDSMLCRDIILDEEYQRLFPHVRIKRGEDAKGKYGLTEGGWRIATTVKGRGTGEHPHYKIIDDPHNVKQSESDVERQQALDWFSGTLSSRGLMLNAATILIMQRLHAKDLTGYIMALPTYKEEWVHVVIPMKHEVGRELPAHKLDWVDPRTKQDELLWPKVYTPAKVKNLAGELGEYRAAGQLQQRPSPAGGGIIKTEFFQLWAASKPLPDLHFVLQSYDTAFTATTDNDPTACTVWGVGMHESGPYKGETFAILLDAWTEHMKYPALRHKVLDDWKATYGGVLQRNGEKDPLHPARRADLILLEEKGSGISLKQDLQVARLPVHGYNPGHADKIARAHIASPLLEAENFYVLESKKEPGKPVTWARPFFTQCEEFPNGENDDYVDTFTQAAIYLRDAGFLALREAPEEPPETVDYHALKSKANPYKR